MTEFGETSNVAITFLIENRTDMLVKSTDTVKYYADRPLIAEHGFSALVELKTQGLKILWDTGATRHAALENMRRMQIDPTTINVIALSHGHGDHTTGLAEILRAMDVRPKPRRWEPTASQEEMLRHARGQQVPIVAHPAAFRERWETPSDGTRYGPIAAPPKEEWEAAGGQVVFSKEPYVLAPGCQTTGPIPRTSFETAGVSSSMSYREGAAFVRDYTEDDQALIINVQGKGLVILSGCAHSGVVNTVNHAREISGVRQVWAILGGFHLAKADITEIERTIDEIVRFKPKMVVPSHCTGLKAVSRFAQRLPAEFKEGLVGATFLF